MRFEIEIPTSPYTLSYGFDPATGDWFGELTHVGSEKVVDSYDATLPSYDHTRPLNGLLAWIGEVTDLYDQDDLHEVLERLLIQHPEDLPRRLRLTAQIVCNLKVAGDNE